MNELRKIIIAAFVLFTIIFIGMIPFHTVIALVGNIFYTDYPYNMLLTQHVVISMILTLLIFFIVMFSSNMVKTDE